MYIYVTALCEQLLPGDLHPQAVQLPPSSPPPHTYNYFNVDVVVFPK